MSILCPIKEECPVFQAKGEKICEQTFRMDRCPVIGGDEPRYRNGISVSKVKEQIRDVR